jgi:hypothetical protein
MEAHLDLAGDDRFHILELWDFGFSDLDLVELQGRKHASDNPVHRNVANLEQEEAYLCAHREHRQNVCLSHFRLELFVEDLDALDPDIYKRQLSPASQLSTLACICRFGEDELCSLQYLAAIRPRSVMVNLPDVSSNSHIRAATSLFAARVTSWFRLLPS